MSLADPSFTESVIVRSADTEVVGPGALSATSGDAAEVFLPVEWIVVSPRPGRGRPTDRLVVVEG